MAWIDDLYSRIADFREVIGIKLNYLYDNKEDITNKQDNLLSADPLHYPNVPAVRNGIIVAIDDAIDDLNLDLDTRYIKLSEKGVANGVATLDGSGHVPAAQLPGFVDDVIDLVDFVANNPTSGMTVGQKWYNTTSKEIFEATSTTTGISSTPVSDAIYVNTEDNTTWRWTGSTMVQMNGGLVLGETSTTAYRGDRGKIAYDHTFIMGNPHNTQISDIPGLTTDLAGKANIRLDNLPSNLSGAEQTSIRTKLGVGTGNGSLNTVGVVMPVSFVVTNSPLTGTGGTITITIATGYMMPTTAQAAEWDEAYDEMHTHANMAILNATTASFTTAQQTKLTNLNIFTISRNGTNIPIVSNNVNIPIFSTTGAGLVPPRVGSVSTKYLREDGTWVIPTNTTYSNMAIAELNTGTLATGRVISASVLNQWIDGKDFATEAWVTAGFATLSHTHVTSHVTALTGYALGTNVAIATSDTLNSALGKLQAQVNAKTSNVGTVTNIGATVAGTALNVAPATITSAGTFAFTWGGTASQYVNGLGNLVTMPTVNNGTLTLATSADLTGSATFTANQSGGSTFTVGLAAATIAKIDNGDTAFDWGDHSLAGYLTSASLTGYATQTWVTANYIPKTHPVNNITLAKIGQWDAAYTHSVDMGDATQPVPDWATQLLSMLNF